MQPPGDDTEQAAKEALVRALFDPPPKRHPAAAPMATKLLRIIALATGLAGCVEWIWAGNWRWAVTGVALMILEAAIAQYFDPS